MADEFRFDADEFEDDEEDGDDVFKQDIVMFMVDYGLIDVDGSSDLFQATIGNIAEFCKAKAISAPKDFVGVCLYRIDSNENPQSVEGVRLIQPLAQVSVESILQLESLATSQSALETLGMPLNDNGISLPNALWICGHAFLDTKRKQAYKRLMMFTADDDPHRNSSGHAMATKSRLRDLHQQNVRVELFGFDSSPHAFDYQRFFVEAFPETKAGEETPFRQVSDMDEFSREIKKRRQIKRVLAKLDFTLCADMRLAVNVYNLYSETKRPYFSHVCARNNAVAMSRTRFEPKGPPISIGAAAAAAEEAPPAVTETKLVDRSELVQIFNYGGKNIVFSAHEMIQIRGLLEPGLVLFGFKPIHSLKPHHQIKHSYFLFPDETRVTGSVSLFSALISRMHHHQVFALCSMQIRPGWSPRLVALLPQMERVDESGFTILPAGMNAIVLPWADDIRDPPTTVIESVGDAEVEVAKKIVDKLSLDSFDPAAFLNPSLQLFYNSIEALALERSEVSPFTDTITPDPNQFGRIATLFTEILTLIPDQTELPAEAPTKRKKTTDAPSSDLHDMYKIGKLSKATVAQLKAFLTGVGITPEKKKSDLLDQASDYFEKL